MDPSILIFDTPLAAAEACGDRTLELLNEARRERSVATLAVSGGSTPKLMFEAMAKRKFAWHDVQIFQVDERCVPPADPLSNFRMVKAALLEPAEIEEAQFHRVMGELEPEVAARAYADNIRQSFNLDGGELPVFDVIQRGTGPDAHTASLFPGDPLIRDLSGITAAVSVENQAARHRVTLLPGVLEKARHTLCLATGAEKADALFRVLRGTRDPLRVPSQIASADTVWYIDRAAAARL